jgi:mono/diheme cytochrome c family protein
MPRVLAVLPAVLLASVAVQVIAQVPTGDPAAGQHLAEAHCVACHALEGKASEQQRAPSFQAVSRMPSTTSMSLHAFLLTSHPTMPNFRLSEQEVDDVVTYILSLRQR